jgi:CBS domain-containing protein
MPDLIARDVMQSDILTVTPETPVLDIHRMFVEEEIHGAPVVDDDGTVCGVVSSLDLLRIVRDELEPSAGEDEPTARDAMSRELVSVPSSATISEIANVMRSQRIHRVLVIDNKELLGVITTFDLLQALISQAPLAQRTGYSS